MPKIMIEDYSIGYPLDDSTIDTKPLVREDNPDRSLIENYHMPESDRAKRNRRRREKKSNGRKK